MWFDLSCSGSCLPCLKTLPRHYLCNYILYHFRCHYFAAENENRFLSPQVLGFCLPRNADDSLWVAMVTELGESVDLIKLLQMSWEDRLRVGKSR